MAVTEQNVAWTIVSASKLTQASLPVPTPGPNQVLIRIKAVSLNYRDHLIVHHSTAYPFQAAPDLIPCSDGAGTVVAAGESSKWHNRIGSSVVVHINTWMDGDIVDGYKFEAVLGGAGTHGTLTRYLVLDDDRVLGAPKALDDVETAALETAGLTAFNALFEGPGEVGRPAKDEKLEVTKKLGATHVINYRKTPAWADEVLRITNGRGVDHVIEVGGAGTIEESLRSTRTGGLVTVMGILTESKKTDLIPAILYGAKTIRGLLGSGSKAMNERFIKFVEEHQIRPEVGKVYEFEQAPEAFARLEKQSEIGKIVIKV
ncbi:hypothetical protein SLS57_011351 [Botryosphaeria dothidea]